MKLRLISFGLLSFATLLPLTPSLTPAARACVAADATTQVSVHPEGTTAQQQNDVNMAISPDCSNNNAIGTTTQINMGPNSSEQTHQGNYNLSGGAEENGYTTPQIKVPVGIQVDVPVPKESFGIGQ